MNPTCMCVCSVTKSCPVLCDPMDCSPLGSSAHGIFQARILAWIAISYFTGSSQFRDWTQVSCIGRWIIYHIATGEALCEPHARHLHLSHREQGPGICHFQSSPGCSAAQVKNLHSILFVSYFIEKLKQPEDNPHRLPAAYLLHFTYTVFLLVLW